MVPEHPTSLTIRERLDTLRDAIAAARPEDVTFLRAMIGTEMVHAVPSNEVGASVSWSQWEQWEQFRQIQ